MPEVEIRRPGEWSWSMQMRNWAEQHSVDGRSDLGLWLFSVCNRLHMIEVLCSYTSITKYIDIKMQGDWLMKIEVIELG